MEGISHEVCFISGYIKLGNWSLFGELTTYFYRVMLKGWFTDNTPQNRFEAYGWHVIADVRWVTIPVAIKKRRIEARENARN